LDRSLAVEPGHVAASQEGLAKQTGSVMLGRSMAKCVFCGERGGSDEDVFAKWIAEVLGNRPFAMRRDHGRSKTNLRYLGLTSRAPCETCNNTWMSRVEGAAKPLLTPVILNKRTRWESAAEQLVVARWAFKTALMLDSASRPERQNAPANDFKDFFQTRKPPQGVTIDLAHYEPEPGEEAFAAWADMSWAGPGDNPRRRDAQGYRVTFSVGYAIFQVHRIIGPNSATQRWERVVYRNGEPLADVFRPLWPLTLHVHEWPPSGLAFSTNGLELLKGRNSV